MDSPSSASQASEPSCAAAAQADCVPTAVERVQQLFALGRFDDALAQGEQALQGGHLDEQPDEACELLVALSLALAEADRHDEAIARARAAHALAQAHGLEARMPRVLALLGGLHGPLQAWAEGESLLLLALSLARDRHDTATVVVALNGLLMHLLHALDAQRSEGQQREADATALRLLRLARQSAHLAVDVPQAFRRAVLRSNAEAALVACEQPEEGLALLHEALADAERGGFRVVALRARSRLGHAHLGLGQLGLAEQQARLLKAQLDADDHPLARLELLRLQAGLAQAAGDGRAAQHWQAQHAALQEPRRALEDPIRQAMAGFTAQT